MTGATKAIWVKRLRKAAMRTLGEDLAPGDWHPDRISEFSDERGHRRAVDQYLLAWRGRADGVQTSAPSGDIEEAQLWSALTRDDVRIDAVIADRLGTENTCLFPQPADVVIEVWTETELASLHALWWHAHTSGDARLNALVRDVGAWHVDRLQPDNATNHPWGVHVFLLLHLEHSLVGADLYAQTLLHNSMVSEGRPDRLSAHILADSADALERSLAHPLIMQN